MDSILKEFIQSGKALLADTKRPAVKQKTVEKVSKESMMGYTEQDPHKILIRRVVKEKPGKKEVIEHFKRFIDQAEADL